MSTDSPVSSEPTKATTDAASVDGIAVTASVSVESESATISATDEKPAAAMEMDVEAFAMSLDELTEASASDQLYDELTSESNRPKTVEPIKHDNQTDHNTASPRPIESTSSEIEEHAIKTELPPANEPTPTPTPTPTPQPTRKSPRRHASSKATTTTTKIATGGTKRTNNQSQSQPHQSFSWNDILHVQSLIERCLQQLLTKNDIVLTLQAQAKVDPAFTAVVWQKLEEQNPAFFRAYALQLQLKEQITAFNFLVSQQKEMMAKASGNAAFLSFLASSDARKNQRQTMVRTSRLASVSHARPRTNTPSPVPVANSVQLATSNPTTNTAMEMPTSQGFPLSSPLPLPSPMKTDLDTQAFFS